MIFFFCVCVFIRTSCCNFECSLEHSSSPGGCTVASQTAATGIGQHGLVDCDDDENDDDDVW